MNALINWKTSAAGAAAIFSAFADMANMVAGNVGTGNIGADLAAISVGIGLVFAKDAGKVPAAKP